MEEQNDIFDHLKVRKSPLPDDSYFESLAKNVINSHQKTRVIPLYKRPVFWISAVAALFVVSFLVINFTSTSTPENDPLLALNDLSSDELFNYIDENIDDFDTDLIVEVMNESTIDEITFSESENSLTHPTNPTQSTETTISFDDIDTQDILDYLNSEGIDSDDLEDEDPFI
jgi:hypothetical protein